MLTQAEGLAHQDAKVLHLDNSLVFHYFFLDDWLVLSNSVAFSQVLLERAGRTPAPQWPHSSLVAVGGTDNRPLLAYLREWQRRSTSPKEGAGPSTLSILTNLVEWFPKSRWMTWDTDEHRVEQGEVQTRIR